MEREAISAKVTTLLTQLQIPVVATEAIPPGFEPLTEPIDIAQEAQIIESMWSSLRNTEAVAVVSEGLLVFWRRAVIPRYTIRSGAVTTR